MPNSSYPTEVQELTYARAINTALREALLLSEDVILYGEDVGEAGGIFGVTKKLNEEFGDRVFDTPISEAAMLGTAVGVSMTGLRPIVEIMWIDFTLVAMDQIVTQAANVRFVSAGSLSAPLTIRTQQGHLLGSCAQHSQNLGALYAHTPGLRVGLAATAQDAYTMTSAAIACNAPTLLIENRGLYHGEVQNVTTGGAIEAVGGSVVMQPGKDVTIMTWSAMLFQALKAARVLEGEGISAEVINARWLNPFDWDTLYASLRKTGRLIIAHEAVLTGGFGAEIATRVNTVLFGMLLAPVKRVATVDSRIPCAPHLQKALIPDAGTITMAARELVCLK